MKRFSQFLLVVSFGLLFAHTPYVSAQEVPVEVICVLDEQTEEEVCEEQTEIPVLVEDPIDKGVPSIETVAGTEAELADEPEVLGDSTEVLAETGTNTELIAVAGALLIITAALLFKTNRTYKLNKN